MISRIGFFANLMAGYRLKMNVAAKAVSSHPLISTTVKLVIRGSGTKISKVIIIPNAIPAAQLESKTTRLCPETILTIVLGLAPKALKTPNS
jgi:hypothetical protein